ncbi:uncharacterized protein [Mycetomoellerius zeteki]|uniref:uncharacterized protein n=1 Tax=Mycetomoellerius zeteki TaxID=64791 RepID=UPI00084EC120|nr:PREDICTED: uncharacterized protein LOC108727235 [Trachymyrmex zeteki]
MNEQTSFGKFWTEFIEETISDSEDSEYVCDTELSTDSQISSEELDEQFSESGNDLYDNDGTGCDIFRATMSYKRMRFLLKCIRFDNIDDRQERILVDKLAAIREIFEDFVANCKTHYNISEYATVDEIMLDRFRGKCSFPQYIKSKPEKYGIKIFVLVDTQTLYTTNLEIYSETQPDGPYKVSNDAFDVVKRLVQPISGTRRNITMDDWFSSVSLAKALLKDNNLTIVATIQKNEKEIPSSFVTSERRELYSSKFRFSKNMTLVSYVPKKKKTALLLSTMHYDDALNDDDPKKIPQIIEFYNRTKESAINAQIVYQTNNKYKTIRRSFLKQLGMELVQQHLENRLETCTLSRSLRQHFPETESSGENE